MRDTGCVLCGSPGLVKQLKCIPFIGADEVYLDGVTVWCCDSCGENCTEIPDLRRLVDEVVLMVAYRKGRLTPIEVKLLLQHLCVPGENSLSVFGVGEDTFQGWMEGHTPLSLEEEKWLRLFVAAHHKKPTDSLVKLLSAPESGPRESLRVDVRKLQRDT